VLERVKDFFLNVRDAAFVALLYLFLMVVVILAVVVLVLYYFMSSIPVITSGPLNTTQSKIQALAAAGTNLFTVALIIIAAAGVIAAVGLIYMGRRREM
jgi:hypothetical protein